MRGTGTERAPVSTRLCTRTVLGTSGCRWRNLCPTKVGEDGHTNAKQLLENKGQQGGLCSVALVTSFPSCCVLPSAHLVEQGTVRAVLMIGKLDKSFPVSPMLLPGGGTLCETSETGDMV